MLFFLRIFWLCHEKIVRAQNRTNDPFKNETQENLKRLKKYFVTNHSNYETREREKERGEQIFRDLLIDCQHGKNCNDGQECIGK
jgi:hypothetical protein